MKKEIVEILVEEASMKNFLEVILPKILPDGFALNINCFIRPHQGKSDLQKSIPRKVKAFQHFPQQVKLIIIHDQDSNDCIKLKTSLAKLIQKQNTLQPYLIRIACKELENWYLGDMKAIENVYTKFKASKYLRKAKYRNPDRVYGSEELSNIIINFSKGLASREIPKNMALEENKSPSFNHLLTGIKHFLAT